MLELLTWVDHDVPATDACLLCLLDLMPQLLAHFSSLHYPSHNLQKSEQSSRLATAEHEQGDTSRLDHLVAQDSAPLTTSLPYLASEVMVAGSPRMCIIT